MIPLPPRPTPHGLAIAAGTLLAAAGFCCAQTYPAGFTGTELLSGSFSGASSMALAPDGRVYIAQHSGEVRVWHPVTGTAASPFATFNVEYAGERGLIGIAVDPSWATNRYVYVHYSRASPANGAIIKRLTASAANPNIPVAGSEVTLIDLGNYASTTPAHVGGGMHFGPDGKLYVGVGECAVNSTSQSLNSPWGKLLRINPDPADPVPLDNPTTFAGIPGSPTGLNRVAWAVGLRNPFTFAFHPVTGRLFINDVGQSDWEEIDEGLPGKNFGWPDTEGDFNQAAFPNYTRPFFAYSHDEGFCITGAHFYRPPQHTFPADYHNDFFFADYVFGWVRRIDSTTKVVTPFASGIDSVVDTLTDSQGRLLVLCDGAPARLYRIAYTAPLAPTILTHPAAPAPPQGEPAVFNVYASGSSPLAYQWRRDGAPLADGGNISGATTATLTIANPGCTESGAYDCIVTNTSGGATSNTASLGGGGQPPVITQQPAPIVSCVLGSATFTCAATGATSFTWFRVGQPAPLGSGPTLTLTLLQEVSTGSYFCRITGGCGSVDTQPAALTLCYANCDCSTTAPTLNFADFNCFLQRFAVGHRYANCDGSTAVPYLNIADFTCFLAKFAAGCPQ